MDAKSLIYNALAVSAAVALTGCCNTTKCAPAVVAEAPAAKAACEEPAAKAEACEEAPAAKAVACATTPKGSSVFDKMDGDDRDGKVTSDELRSYKIMRMIEMDANKDGQVTPEEISEYQFKEMDTFADESISPEEYAEFMVGDDYINVFQSTQPVKKSQGDFIFSQIDKNEDGFYDVNEFASSAQTQFKHYDHDKNGEISKEEFKKQRWRELKIRDEDQSGALGYEY